MSPVAALQNAIVHAWGTFLLRDSEKKASARSSAQQDLVARRCQLAKKLERSADGLDDPDDAVAALILYRETAILLATAIADAKSAPPSAPGLGGAKAALEIALLEAPVPPSDDVFALRDLVAAVEPRDLEASGAESLRNLRDRVRTGVKWLGSQIDPRPVQVIRAARVWRLIALACALVGVVVWVTRSLLARPNLALDKPAFASSQRPGTPPASGVNNGQIESTFGVHTNTEDNPWVMIDLGDVHGIREVRVYNRGDGWADEGLPLVLQVSPDARAWTEVARRTVSYSQANPWIAALSSVRGRYVRVQVPRHGYIALSEIEVF